jgi:hypothetical protein
MLSWLSTSTVSDINLVLWSWEKTIEKRST